MPNPNLYYYGSQSFFIHLRYKLLIMVKPVKWSKRNFNKSKIRRVIHTQQQRIWFIKALSK